MLILRLPVSTPEYGHGFKWRLQGLHVKVEGLRRKSSTSPIWKRVGRHVLGTLSGPFFSHLIGSSSAGFTELILTRERVEAEIKNGKIQKYASPTAVRKPFIERKKWLFYILIEIKIGPNAVQWWGLLWFLNLRLISKETISQEWKDSKRCILCCCKEAIHRKERSGCCISS